MITQFKYIHFVEYDGLLGKYWHVKNNKSKNTLGVIDYYKEWRQYTFEGCEGCIFNTTCLLDIVSFLKQLNESKHSEA